MYYFANDYSEGAHKKVLEALIKTNYIQCAGYGLDEFSAMASSKIKKLINFEDVDIHYVSGGTQANRLCLSAFLRSHEAIICPSSGHINVHEAGSIEASGHKIIQTKGINGKITAQEILEVLKIHTDEHMVKPKLVFITDATEIGSIYTKEELVSIHDVCKKHGLYLYLDGARLANALCAHNNDLTLEDINNLTDAFYLGGTKNGLLLGEAIIISNDELKKDFRYFMKQNGAMLAKGRVLGVQFNALLEDNLFLDLADHANIMAQKIQSNLVSLGIPLFIQTSTNQIFPILPNAVIEELRKDFVFLNWEYIDEDHSAVRFVCSWATREEDVDTLIKKVKNIYAHQ